MRARAARAVDQLGALDPPRVLQLGDLGRQERAVRRVGVDRRRRPARRAAPRRRRRGCPRAASAGRGAGRRPGTRAPGTRRGSPPPRARAAARRAPRRARRPAAAPSRCRALSAAGKRGLSSVPSGAITRTRLVEAGVLAAPRARGTPAPRSTRRRARSTMGTFMPEAIWARCRRGRPPACRRRRGRGRGRAPAACPRTPSSSRKPSASTVARRPGPRRRPRRARRRLVEQRRPSPRAPSPAPCALDELRDAGVVPRLQAASWASRSPSVERGIAHVGGDQLVERRARARRRSTSLQRPGRSGPPGRARCTARSPCPGSGRRCRCGGRSSRPTRRSGRRRGRAGVKTCRSGVWVPPMYGWLVRNASPGRDVVAPLREHRLQRELHQPELGRDLLGVRDHAARRR